MAVHELGDARERQGERVWRSRCIRLAGALVIGEHDRASGGIEAAGEHAPRFPRFTSEHGVAVERDDDDVGVDDAGPLRLERGQSGIHAAVFGELLTGRLRKRDPFALRPFRARGGCRQNCQPREEFSKGARKLPSHAATFIGEHLLRKR